MTNATIRSILRWVHLVAVIPVLGFIYGDPKDVAQYVGGVRFIFIPLLMFSGYWMYAGIVFAVMGVAAWLGVFYFVGFGWALLGQIVLLAGRKIWLKMRG